jgi:predicted AlkP superfamily phosphohydrolase/phosphomutase
MTSARPATVPRLLVVGLDGATWALFAPWTRAGRLPHLAALMARGAWGPLRSTVPALTLPAWSSFMTGKNPGGHGIYAFRRMAVRQYESPGLANATDLRAVRIWDVAAHAGRSVGVINVPPSYPLRPIANGYLVGCMLTPPGERFTEPPDVADELGDYEIDLSPPKGLRRSDPDYRARALAYLRGVRRQTRLRAEATLRVMARRPTDAVCVVFYAPDRVQHYFWEYVDPVRPAADPLDDAVHEALLAVYDELDRALGKLVEAAGPDANVVLLSDHGFGTKPERSVRVNRWLADQGLLRRHALWTTRRRVVRKLFPASWRAHYDTLDHILVNRPRSRAWSEALSTGAAAIWVHVRGRYPLGCVAPGAEYERIRSDIRDGLQALTDAAGQPVFRLVARREELYRGPHVESAPDLVAICEPRFGIIFESLRRELRSTDLFGPYEELGYTGTHDPTGLYLLAGPAVQALGEHCEYPIEAVAPTVLHLLDVPVPQDHEVPVMTSALRPEFIAAHPVRVGAPLDEASTAPAGWRSIEDEAHVAEHLRALGYLE